MPRVPESFGASVGLAAGGSTPLSAPGVVPLQDQSGAAIVAIGRSITQAGSATSEIGLKIADEWDDARTREALNRSDEVIYKALQAYRQLEGRAAVGKPRADIFEAMQQQVDAIGAGLSNHVQQRQWSAATQRRLMAARVDADAHEATQLRAYNIGETKARIEGATRDALLAAGTPRFGLYVGLAKVEANSLADQAGLPKNSAQRKEMLTKVTSDVHAGVVQQLLNSQDPVRAQQHLEEASKAGEIERETAAQLAQVVRTAAIKDQSLRLTNRILGESTQPDGRLNMDLALGIADATFKGDRITAEVYDATVKRLVQADAQRRQVHADRINEAQDAAEAWLQQNPHQGPQGLPAELYTLLEQNGKLAEINAFADRGRRVTDPQALEEALTMPPEVLGRLSPAEVRMRYRGRLSPEDLSVVMATHALAGGRATARDTLTLRENLEIELAARDAGILPTDDKPTEAQQTAYDRWRLAALQAREIDPKKPLSEIVREMQQQVVRARGDGTDVNYFALPPEARKTSEIVTPSGRRIPLGAIVDEAGQPMADQILEDIRARNTDIRAENARRAAAGQQQIPEIPETLQAVGAAWERWRLSRIGAGQEGLREEMRLRGMKAYSAGLFGAFAQPGALVGAEDAAALTGLTVPELRERIRAMGAGEHVSPFGSGVTGFPAESVARVVAQQKRGR